MRQMLPLFRGDLARLDCQGDNDKGLTRDSLEVILLPTSTSLTYLTLTQDIFYWPLQPIVQSAQRRLIPPVCRVNLDAIRNFETMRLTDCQLLPECLDDHTAQVAAPAPCRTSFSLYLHELSDTPTPSALLL